MMINLSVSRNFCEFNSLELKTFQLVELMWYTKSEKAKYLDISLTRLNQSQSLFDLDKERVITKTNACSFGPKNLKPFLENRNLSDANCKVNVGAYTIVDLLTHSMFLSEENENWLFWPLF